MHIILLIFGVCIILYNFIINITNLSIIVRYCLQTNSLEEFWPTYGKVCVSGRAIYSTIISFIFALPVFILIAPVILYREKKYGRQLTKALETGLVFEYDNSLGAEVKGLEFYTNSNVAGLGQISVTTTGVIRLDFAMILGEIKTECEKKNFSLRYDVMQHINLEGEQAAVPLLFNINGTDYPLYVIYNEIQKKQFINVSEKFARTGINDVIYFSVFPMESEVAVQPVYNMA